MFIYIRTLSEIILQGVLQTVKKSYPRKRNIFFTEEFFLEFKDENYFPVLNRNNNSKIFLFTLVHIPLNKADTFDHFSI